MNEINFAAQRELPPLAELLADYDRRVRSGVAPPETASVRVDRARGFQNQVTAASGHSVLVDEPETFGGGGRAADPAELLLAAVGASLSVTITAHAAMQDIPVTALAIDLSAWMSAENFLHPGDGLPAGIQEAVIEIRLESSARLADLRALVDRASFASPVLRSLAHVPPLRLIVNGEAA